MQGTLTADETWEGDVEVVDDLLVPRGVTLTIRPGTVVRVRRADTGRTEPEFLDNAAEILVRGTLLALGEEGAPVRFEPAAPGGPGEDPSWGGIIFDGGAGSLRHCRITSSEQGVALLSSSPSIEESAITGVKHGIMLYGPSRPRISRTVVDAAEGGIYCWRGSAPALEHVRARGGEREGLLVAPGASPEIRSSTFEGPLGGVLWGEPSPPPPSLGESLVTLRRISPPPSPPGAEKSPFPPPGAAAAGGPGRIYRGESFIPLDETWEGEVLIDGTVMVAPGALLTVRPGTTVRFVFRDTNGDGIGESEIFVQGRILALGERDRPIVFTAAGEGGRGRWGALNIMGSDTEENQLSWVLIESSYRGLHSHFSSFRVENSLFRNNYRGLQFQESRAVVTGCTVAGNSSALRFRDSTVVVEDCRIRGNTTGLQAFRAQLSLTGSVIADNTLAGIHLRESEGVLSGNVVTGNAPGLRASGGRFRLERNVLAGNSYGGAQFRGTEASLEENRLEGNVGNGLFTDSGTLSLRRNIIAGNLRFALENNSPEPVDAALNFWGVEGGRVADVLYDRGDDPGVGPVITDPVLESPPRTP